MATGEEVAELRETFATHRYSKVEALADPGLCRMLYDYVLQRKHVALPAQMDGQEGAVEIFSDQLMEYVLAGLKPRIQELSGVPLDPTYSFFRLYRRGNILARHLDRAACEISVSLNLGPVLDAPWPLWMEGPLGVSALALQPGDAVLYRGIECFHWREPLEADHQAMLFLHYVEQGGKYADWKFDKRPSLGT